MSNTVLIMAGGTGGHVFPALAVADMLREKGFRTVWLGTRQGIEARVVPAAGIEIEWLPVSGVRGKGGLTLLLAPFRLMHAGFVALKIFRRVQPCVVLGMGGFASGPGGVIARLLRRPLVIHEQNAIAGFTNRLLARIAQRVLVAFPNTLSDVAHEEVVGNPVRSNVVRLDAPKTRFAERAGPLRILVLGGSLGAHALNEIVPAAIVESRVPVEVVHQSGRGDPVAIRTVYDNNNVNATVHAFIEDMAAAYEWADFAVCRAGAMTVYELAAAGLGSVLVPFPHAVDDHQTFNARYLADAGAAIILQERDMTTAGLAAAIREIASRERLLTMAENARRKARPHATQQVAEACLALAGDPS